MLQEKVSYKKPNTTKLKPSPHYTWHFYFTVNFEQLETWKTSLRQFFSHRRIVVKKRERKELSLKKKLNSRKNLIRGKEKHKWGKRNGAAKWNNVRGGIVSVSALPSSLFTSQWVCAVIAAWEAITEITKFSTSGANQCHTEIVYPGRISRCTFNGEMWVLREISQP